MMQIELVRVLPEGVQQRSLTVPQGCTVAVALDAAGIAPAATDAVAVFGQRVKADTLLQEGDRLEIAAPVICDPKAARRERALKQGDVRVVTRGRHGGKHQLIKDEPGQNH